VPVPDIPTTPEGRLIRDWRERQSEMSIPELARRLGFSETKMGAIDRGHTSRQPDRHPTATDMARIAAELRIPPAELDKAAGETETERSYQVLTRAAEILRASPAEPASGIITVPDTSQELRDMEILIGSLLGILDPAYSRAEVLRLLWRDQDGEGGERPRAERVGLMNGVIGGRMAVQGARRTG
jgi:transcriptional regulator with XRE-family HTH domain